MFVCFSFISVQLLQISNTFLNIPIGVQLSRWIHVDITLIQRGAPTGQKVVVPSFSDTFSGAIPCNSDGNGTISDSACAPTVTTPNPDGNSDEELCCNRVLYVAIVCFGVLTLPLTVCLRVCWMKKLRKREQRRLDEVRNRHCSTDRQASVFTVESGKSPQTNIKFRI